MNILRTAMNKYLVKIAAKQKNGFELEPGVTWNSSAKKVEISSANYDQQIKKKQHLYGTLGAALAAPIGAAAGGAMGESLSKSKKLESHVWNHAVRFHHRDHKMIPERLTKKISPDTKVNIMVPNTEYSPKYDALLQKARSAAKLRSRIGGGIGAAVGGVALGSLGYAAKSYEQRQPMMAKITKENYLDKMEQKHSKAIDAHEGWD